MAPLTWTCAGRLPSAPSLWLHQLQCASVLWRDAWPPWSDGDPSGSELAGSDWMQASCGRIHALDPFATATAATLTVCQTLRCCAQMRSAVCRTQSRAALDSIGPQSLGAAKLLSILLLTPPLLSASYSAHQPTPIQPHCAHSGTNVAHASAAHSRCASAGCAQQCEWRATPTATAAPRSVRANRRPRSSAVRLQIRVHLSRFRCG